MDDNPLIVPAHDLLQRGKIQPLVRRIIGHLVVEAQHERLELGNDTVLVVARIADESSRGFGFVGWAVAWKIWGAVVERVSEKKLQATPVIKVGLIAGTATVNIVEIQRRCPKVGQSIWITMLDQGGHW